mgnify:CR=1 FL=1
MVRVEIPMSEKRTVSAEDIPISIVYEDESLLVVDKPAGLVVHPGAGRTTGTLVHALLAHAPLIQGVGGVARPLIAVTRDGGEGRVRGLETIDVRIPAVHDALAAYYVINYAEFASAMQRFDGTRYGATREAFGDEGDDYITGDRGIDTIDGIGDTESRQPVNLDGVDEAPQRHHSEP